MQLSFDVGNSVEADFKLICEQLGMPVLLDAAQFGAYAYRLRNWWCNWLDPVELEAVAAGVRRAPHRYVVDILDSHHEMTGVIRTNGPPFYPVNRGGRVECLPWFPSPAPEPLGRVNLGSFTSVGPHGMMLQGSRNPRLMSGSGALATALGPLGPPA